jgi:hypothetical protein
LTSPWGRSQRRLHAPFLASLRCSLDESFREAPRTMIRKSPSIMRSRVETHARQRQALTCSCIHTSDQLVGATLGSSSNAIVSLGDLPVNLGPPHTRRGRVALGKVAIAEVPRLADRPEGCALSSTQCASPILFRLCGGAQHRTKQRHLPSCHIVTTCRSFYVQQLLLQGVECLPFSMKTTLMEMAMRWHMTTLLQLSQPRLLL